MRETRATGSDQRRRRNCRTGERFTRHRAAACVSITTGRLLGQRPSTFFLITKYIGASCVCVCVTSGRRTSLLITRRISPEALSPTDVIVMAFSRWTRYLAAVSSSCLLFALTECPFHWRRTATSYRDFVPSSQLQVRDNGH